MVDSDDSTGNSIGCNSTWQIYILGFCLLFSRNRNSMGIDGMGNGRQVQGKKKCHVVKRYWKEQHKHAVAVQNSTRYE